ncbi:MAG TPA: F0F1 ATP synthase subunit B [Actinomycetota bacterium]|nr:F0F1 ATP synthase subunit B [Actinomycetota bacterium]
MHALIVGFASVLAQAEEEVSEPKDLYPHAEELIVGALAFTILFVFMAKFVIPRVNTMIEERRTRIQGELEKAESTRSEADQVLGQYREQLANARAESNRIIEEARKTAEEMRRDLLERARQEGQQVVAKARDEIRAERDRAFADLKRQVGELSVELATRVVGESLDRERQVRMVEQYIEEVAAMDAPPEQGNGADPFSAWRGDEGSGETDG